jgi:hypothetical protein
MSFYSVNPFDYRGGRYQKVFVIYKPMADGLRNGCNNLSSESVFVDGHEYVVLDVMYIQEPGTCIYVGTKAQPLFFRTQLLHLLHVVA